MPRPNWDEYFIAIAQSVASRGTCRRRIYGAIIVDTHHTIVSSGYCGAAKGMGNCIDESACPRELMNIPSGQRYDLCKSVHAEQNAIINAPPERMRGATIYIAGRHAKTEEPVNAQPCEICLRFIRNAGISQIVYQNQDTIERIP